MVKIRRGKIQRGGAENTVVTRRRGLRSGMEGLLAEDLNSCYHISTVLVKEYFGASQRFLEMIEGKGDGQGKLERYLSLGNS